MTPIAARVLSSDDQRSAIRQRPAHAYRTQTIRLGGLPRNALCPRSPGGMPSRTLRPHLADPLPRPRSHPPSRNLAEVAPIQNLKWQGFVSGLLSRNVCTMVFTN